MQRPLNLTIRGVELTPAIEADIQERVGEVPDAAERRLEDLTRIQRGQTKRHEPQLRARVVRLSPARDHGFLRTDDGRELYFHRHSLLGNFDALAPGSEVRFHEEAGDDGPQASTVVIVGSGGPRAGG